MKFSVAWAQTLAQNVSLKFATITLLISTLTFAMMLLKLSLKSPIVIERGCFSKQVVPATNDRSPPEIEAFISEALPMRFNGGAAINLNYLSAQEDVARKLEQKELQQKNIVQKVIVNSIKIDGQNILAFCDRIVGVGPVRSIVPVVLSVQLESTTRTESDPYGLVVNQISVQKKDESK